MVQDGFNAAHRCNFDGSREKDGEMGGGGQTSREEHKLLATHHFQANIHAYHIQVFISYSRFGIQTFRSYHFPVIKTDLTTLSVRNFLALAKCKVAYDNTRSGTSNTNQHLCLITVSGNFYFTFSPNEVHSVMAN